MSEKNPNSEKMTPPQKKAYTIKEKQLDKIDDLIYKKDLWGIGKIFIKKKGRVVAIAKWDGDLVITKVNRPDKTNLKVGQKLYEVSLPYQQEIPPKPEIKTEGWQLLRIKNYNNEQAKRLDPYWKDYQGWQIMPDKIDGEPAEDEFLSDYSDKTTKEDIEVKDFNQINEAELKMAEYGKINAYVCGRSDEIPALQNFQIPKQEDMVRYKALYLGQSFLSEGEFMGYERYWVAKWIVYEPRKSSD